MRPKKLKSKSAYRPNHHKHDTNLSGYALLQHLVCAVYTGKTAETHESGIDEWSRVVDQIILERLSTQYSSLKKKKVWNQYKKLVILGIF